MYACIYTINLPSGKILQTPATRICVTVSYSRKSQFPFVLNGICNSCLTPQGLSPFPLLSLIKHIPAQSLVQSCSEEWLVFFFALSPELNGHIL